MRACIGIFHRRGLRWLGSVVEGDVSCDDEGEFLFAGISPESKANHDRGRLTFSSRWRLL